MESSCRRDMAHAELINRDISLKKIKHAPYVGARKKELEDLTKARPSYNIADFIPLMGIFRVGELFEILFSWELKKDGYYRKAKQQKYFRITLGLLIVIIILINKLLELLSSIQH